MSLLRRRMMMNLAKWATITGNPVSFQAVAAKLRQLKVAFAPVQEGSGDPSPENERPIHGWTGVNVWQAGKNLIDWEHPFRLSSWYYGTSVGTTIASLIGTDPTMTASGNELTVAITDSWHGVTFRSPVLPNGNYRLSYKVDATGLTGDRGRDVFAIDKNNKVLRVLAHSATIGNTALSITLSGDEVAIAVSMGTRTGGSGTLKITNALLEQGSTTSDWEAPNVTTIPITIPTPPGTVYGGTIDVLTGDGEITWAAVMCTAVGGGTDWIIANSGQSAGTGLYYATIQNINAPAGYGTTPSAGDAKGLNSVGPWRYAEDNSMPGWRAYTYVTGGKAVPRFIIANQPTPVDTAERVNALLATLSSPVQLSYELATSIPFHVDPQQINSLAGTNTMWSDANGDLTVEYKS